MRGFVELSDFLENRIWKTPLGRRELGLLASAFLLINNLTTALLGVHGPILGPAGLFGDGFGALDILAWGVVVWRLRQASDEAASATDLAVILGLCLLGGLPAKQAAPLAMTALALWLAVRPDLHGRAAALVLGAIASHQLWGKALYLALSPVLVGIDAAMVSVAVGVGVPGATAHENIISVPGGHTIAILPGCASFTNVSAALLAWVALTKLERLEWVRADLIVLAAAVLAQVALNVTRMYLMALSWEHYTYWHFGPGSVIYAVTATAASVAIGAFGAQWAGARR